MTGKTVAVPGSADLSGRATTSRHRGEQRNSTTRVSIDTLTRTISRVALPLAGLVGIGGCAVAPQQAGATSGDRVVVVVSGTANEPRPSLTGQALAVLRTAAASDDVSETNATRGSAAIVTSADGATEHTVQLTPRRADGSVEHGLSRQRLIDADVAAVTRAVAATQATRAGLDLLGGLADAVRGVQPGTLIVVSDGLSTAGGLDLRQVGWHAVATQVAARLHARDLLPNLTGWHVLFTGLGEVAGDQPPLPNPQRDTLVGYWRAICRAAGAASCDIDQTRLPPTKPLATAAMPVVPVPDVSSVVGPHGEVTTTVSDGALGFTGDSAVIRPAARDLLRSLAPAIVGRLADHPDVVVRVRGYAADPPGSTDGGRTALATERARVVATALVAELAAAGLPNRVTATGVGTQPGVTAMVHGRFDEHVAATMRRVVITY